MAGDANRAYQVLKQQLLSGYYAPGTQLKEEAFERTAHGRAADVQLRCQRFFF